MRFPLPNGPQLLDPSQMLLRLRFQIKNADGSKLTGSPKIAPVPGLCGTVVDRLILWSSGRQVKVYNSFNYAYYMLNVWNRRRVYFETVGYCGFWFLDGSTTLPDETWDSNDGINTRRDLSNDSKEFEVCETVFVPPFQSSKYLITENLNWVLEYHLAKTPWLLEKEKTLAGTYELILTHASLDTVRIQLSESARKSVGAVGLVKNVWFKDFETQEFGIYKVRRNL
jgi:hypothetical protein